MTGSRTAALLDMREAVMHEVADKLVDDEVERGPALLSACHELQQTKQRQLVTETRHRKVERVREVADRHLVMCQSVHDADPARIREGLKHIARSLHGLVDGETTSRALDLAKVAGRWQLRLRLGHVGAR